MTPLHPIAASRAELSARCVTNTGTSRTNSFERIWRSVASIHGWLSEAQALVLARSASGVARDSWIVEIGSHHGKTTVLLAKTKRPGTGLLAVDPFDDPRWGGGRDALDVFKRNLETAGVAQSVTLFRGSSPEAAAEFDTARVGLLYVDGAHDRRSVVADLEAWEGLLVAGALVYFHDAFSSVGVTLAVLQRQLVDRRFRYLGSVGSLAAFRHESQTIVSAAADALRLTGRLGYFVRNLAVKLALRRGWARVCRLLGHHDSGCPY
jgi:predicted O-methyltransferase YrrM